MIIEQNYNAFSIIKKNFNILGIKNSKLIKNDSLKYIKKIKDKFDIIFLDPPYDNTEYYHNILTIVSQKELLKPDGKIVCEMKSSFELQHENFSILKNRKYGSSRIMIFEKK